MADYHYGASILLVSTAGKVLLQERDDKPGIQNPGKLAYWGGACELGERPIDAAMREIREETNLTPDERDFEFFGEYKRSYTIDDKQVVNIVYVLREINEQAFKSYEGRGFRSIAPNNVAARSLCTTLTQEILRDWIQSLR